MNMNRANDLRSAFEQAMRESAGAQDEQVTAQADFDAAQQRLTSANEKVQASEDSIVEVGGEYVAELRNQIDQVSQAVALRPHPVEPPPVVVVPDPVQPAPVVVVVPPVVDPPTPVPPVVVEPEPPVVVEPAPEPVAVEPDVPVGQPIPEPPTTPANQ